MEHLQNPISHAKLVHIYGLCSQKVHSYGTHVHNYRTFGCRAKSLKFWKCTFFKETKAMKFLLNQISS